MVRQERHRLLTLMSGHRASVPAPPAYDPTAITGNILWLKPDLNLQFTDTAGTSEITSNGQTMARWDDSSGGSRNATQSTAGFRPTANISAQNARPMMLFDGTNDYLVANAVGALIDGNDQAFTLALVYKSPSAGLASGTLWSGGSSSSDNPYVRGTRIESGTPGVGFTKEDDGAVPKSTTGTCANDAKAHVAVWRFNGTTLDLWRDGTQILTAADANVGLMTLNQFAIGALGRTTVSDFINVYIGEVIVWDNAISNGNVATTNTALIAKWAIVV